MIAASRLLAVGIAVLVLALAVPAHAFDAEQSFHQHALLLSVEGGGGEQFNLEGKSQWSHLEFWNTGVRLGILPLAPMGPGPLRGALEVGLEPFYQRYTHPVDAHWAGMSAIARYHFLSLGRFVPYVELAAGAGDTDLRVLEIRSEFAFLLWGGVGASVMLSDGIALYGGYRYEHVSNGNTSRPNRGFELHDGVGGLTFFIK